MRLLLIALQVTVAALAYISTSIGALEKMLLDFHSEPLATAAIILIGMQLLLLGVFFFAKTFPLFVVLLGTFTCAVLAGYRPFRWARWIGLAINIAAACYCLLTVEGIEVKYFTIKFFGTCFIFFFLCNSVLFFMIPKQPDIRKNHEIIACAHLVLPCPIVLPVLLILAISFSFDPIIIIAIIVSFLVYRVPFAINYHATRAISLSGDTKKAILPLIVSLAVGGLGGLVTSILAIPVGISLLIFILFLEMLFLYPEDYPQRAWHVHCVRLLGRLPDRPVSAAP